MQSLRALPSPLLFIVATLCKRNEVMGLVQAFLSKTEIKETKIRILETSTHLKYKRDSVRREGIWCVPVSLSFVSWSSGTLSILATCAPERHE